MSAADQHQKLEQGALWHECDDVESAVVKIAIEDAPGEELFAIVRKDACSHGIRDFNVILKTTHPLQTRHQQLGSGPKRGWVFVVRMCASHANIHRHRWSHLFFRDKNDIVDQSFGPLDTMEEAGIWFERSNVYVVRQAVERRREWLVKAPSWKERR